MLIVFVEFFVGGNTFVALLDIKDVVLGIVFVPFIPVADKFVSLIDVLPLAFGGNAVRIAVVALFCIGCFVEYYTVGIFSNDIGLCVAVGLNVAFVVRIVLLNVCTIAFAFGSCGI